MKKNVLTQLWMDTRTNEGYILRSERTELTILWLLQVCLPRSPHVRLYCLRRPSRLWLGWYRPTVNEYGGSASWIVKSRTGLCAPPPRQIRQERELELLVDRA